MHKPMARIVALMALSGSALLAQDVTGTWQGTLVAGRELRTVIKISKTPSGSLGATLYSIRLVQSGSGTTRVEIRIDEGADGRAGAGPRGEAGGQLDIQSQRGVEESLAALAGAAHTSSD